MDHCRPAKLMPMLFCPTEAKGVAANISAQILAAAFGLNSPDTSEFLIKVFIQVFDVFLFVFCGFVQEQITQTKYFYLAVIYEVILAECPCCIHYPNG